MSKVCKRCNKETKESGFYKSHKTICKECIKTASKKRRIEKPDEIQKYQKAYRKENVEEIRKYQKEYRKNHKEEATEYIKQYYINNRVQLLEYKKRWGKENYGRRNKENDRMSSKRYKLLYPEKIADYNKQYRKAHPGLYEMHARKRRALKKKLIEIYSVSDELYTKDLFNNCCVNCGSTENLTIDHHYPLSKGHVLTRQNAVLLCRSCNSKKHTILPEVFYSKETLLKIETLLGIKTERSGLVPTPSVCQQHEQH